MYQVHGKCNRFMVSVTEVEPWSRVQELLTDLSLGSYQTVKPSAVKLYCFRSVEHAPLSDHRAAYRDLDSELCGEGHAALCRG